MTARARRALGRRVWLRAMAVEVLRGLSPATASTARASWPRTSRSCSTSARGGGPRASCTSRSSIPTMVRAPWPVPRIDTVGELAERFELDPGSSRGWRTCAGSSARWRTAGCATTPTCACRAAVRPAARDRASEGAAEGDPAPRSCARSSPGSRSTTPRTGSSAGARRARTPPCTWAAASSCGSTSRTSSPRVTRRARLRDLPHRRLSRGRRAHADGAVHERGAARRSRSTGTTGSRGASPRRTCRRARRPRPRWRTSRPSGSTAG